MLSETVFFTKVLDGAFHQTVFLTDSTDYPLFRPFSLDDSGFSAAVLYFLVNKLIFMPQAADKGFKNRGQVRRFQNPILARQTLTFGSPSFPPPDSPRQTWHDRLTGRWQNTFFDGRIFPFFHPEFLPCFAAQTPSFSKPMPDTSQICT